MRRKESFERLLGIAFFPQQAYFDIICNLPETSLDRLTCYAAELNLAKLRWQSSRGGYSTKVVPQLKAAQKLPSIPARTRFAPSPTGYLHLGSLRTALYNYLLAKATGGQFLLRIEDTDTKRTISGAEDSICRDLAWAGLQWDEGPQIGGPYAPYRQSERTAQYQEHAAKLLDSRHAYRCFCTQERLDSLARERKRLGLPTYYDRNCLSITKEESDERAHRFEPHVVRLVTPAQYPEYNDLVYGHVGKPKGQRLGPASQNSFEDPVLLKSDGSPTYHLANVVDDHHMKITHVIRGAEWMPSTPKHLELYKAFDWDPPAFAHVALLQDTNKQKLSKRDLNMDLEKLRREGILPEALMNFVALLGWSHSMGSDFFSPQQLIDNFSLKFTKGNVVVNFGKLNYLQGLHFRNYLVEANENVERIVDQIVTHLREDSKIMILPETLNGRTLREFVMALLRMDTSSSFTIASSFVERHRSIFGYRQSEPGRAIKKPRHELLLIAEAVQQIREVQNDNWSVAVLKNRVASVTQYIVQKDNFNLQSAENLKDPNYVNNSLLTWLRWAIVDGQHGPSMFDIMALLGRDTTLRRLKAAQLELSVISEEDAASSSENI
ncbi:Glutamate--tRNA ligase mitochondrial [Xylographa opegraphella]|nr:Glutamate--tRNA ligase mitochondrial [Xylographa opegraphella]